MVADPFAKPHVAGKDVYVDVNADGSVILKFELILQLFASVMVTAYAPADNPFKLPLFVCAGVHE